MGEKLRESKGRRRRERERERDWGSYLMAFFSLCCSNEFSRGNAQIADLVLFFLKTKSLFYAFSLLHISPGKSRTPYTLYTGFFLGGGICFILLLSL